MSCDGIIHQLGLFAASIGRSEREIEVVLYLVDGTQLSFLDFRVDSPFGGDEWLMLRRRQGEPFATLIRETEIQKIEFSLPNIVSAKNIGFHAEP